MTEGSPVQRVEPSAWSKNKTDLAFSLVSITMLTMLPYLLFGVSKNETSN